MKKKLTALFMIMVMTVGIAGCNVLDKFRTVDTHRL